MKWYNSVMFILTVTCVSIVLLALTGCGGIDQHQYEKDKIESKFRKAELGSHNDNRDLENKEWQEYESMECEYDDSISARLANKLKNVKLDEIELTEDEMPKYQILELGNGKTKIMWKGDGKDPHKNNKKVAGFTVPDADPTDCIGEVCREDSVPYLSNYFATGNVEGEQRENFKEWYEKEIRKAKMKKYLSQNQKYGMDFYECKTVTNFRAKDANKSIPMPKEWMDQWPSLRENN